MNVFKAIFLATLFLPCAALACSSTGFTVVYVNGILTNSDQAKSDAKTLQNLLGSNFEDQAVKVYNGYNPSHLDGAGDILESISQAFNTPLSDYDLDTILTQIAPEVTTQKVLLVGHSQGTFYTNELYGYLIANGISPLSIAVYNLATPANYVAGNGNYLTSDNDKVINYVRRMDATWGIPQALAANTSIAEEAGYAGNAWGGHFPDVYFDGAPDRIVSDIDTALSGLIATTTLDVCFTSPNLGLSYETQQMALRVADPAVAGIQYATVDTRNTIASVGDNANDIIHTAFLDAYFSVFPKPDVQSAAGVFAVEKALYGSSLSVADYEALANGQDIPEVQTQAQKAEAAVPPQPIQPTVVAPPPVPPEVVQPVQNPIQVTPQWATPTAPMSSLIRVAPGFGGGAPAPSISAAVPSTNPTANEIDTSDTEATTTADVSATSTDQTASTTPPIATSTPPVEVDTSTTTDATSSAPAYLSTPTGCPSIVANGYFFDSFQEAEYVGGLLRVHLRLLTPYNDGRPFRTAVVTIGNNCKLPQSVFGFGFPSTSIPAGVQYYSFRMSTPTHWVLWDDEHDTQIECGSTCEGDIDPNASFISFYGLIDSGASELITTPFPPTGG